MRVSDQNVFLVFAVRDIVLSTKTGRIILKWVLQTECEDVDWIHVAQNRDEWFLIS
jgi:hypothetical protein